MPNQQVHAPSTIHVSVRILGDDHRRFPFRIDPDASLLELMEQGASEANVNLIANPNEPPLDNLRNMRQHQQIGPPISNLDESVQAFLAHEGNTNDFAIELVLAIRVNTRWAITTSAAMTPRQILALFGLDFQEYSLYPANSPALLPLDTPISLSRGDAFEAQRDGKYGGTRAGL